MNSNVYLASEPLNMVAEPTKRPFGLGRGIMTGAAAGLVGTVFLFIEAFGLAIATNGMPDDLGESLIEELLGLAFMFVVVGVIAMLCGLFTGGFLGLLLDMAEKTRLAPGVFAVGAAAFPLALLLFGWYTDTELGVEHYGSFAVAFVGFAAIGLVAGRIFAKPFQTHDSQGA